MRITNHVKQRVRLRFTINNPVGTENFMTAMLRVSLSKHH